MTSASNANTTAQGIIRAAIAEKDALTLGVLLGEPFKFQLQGISGVTRLGLVKYYVAQQIAADPRMSDKYYMAGTVPAYRFLTSQDGDQGLVKLPQLAQGYYDSMKSAATSLLALPTVRSATTA